MPLNLVRDETFVPLRQAVYEANLALVRAGLVVLTWGNASGLDRARGILAIKPSGVPYSALRPDDMVLVSLETGEALPDQALRPSSDTPTHVCLYRSFANIGGIAHTHSRYATSWAQAGREIPCYGTTHADTFHGSIPLCRPLSAEEIAEGYEWNTGKVIVEHFAGAAINPDHTPGVLLPFHAPFAWGNSPADAAEHAIVVEEVAALAWHTEMLNPQAATTPAAIVEKHFTRKHGKDAYYGQPKPEAGG